MVLRQVVTFPRTNCSIAVSSEKCHWGKQSVVPFIVFWKVIDKHFVINKIMLQCLPSVPIGELSITFYLSILGKAH